MKKLITILLLLFSTIVFSQSKYSSKTGFPGDRFFLDVLSGVSLPFGDFAKTEPNGGSYAQLGFLGTVQLNWMFKEKLGLRVGVSGLFHSVNASELTLDEFEEDPFLEDLTIRSESYRLLNVFLAVVYKKEINHKLNVLASGGAGLLYAETPHQLYRARHFVIGNNYFEVTSAGDYTLMYNLSIEAEYKIREGWALIGGSKFNYANTEFEFNRLGQDENRIDKRKINAVDFFLGFRLFF